MLEFSTNNKKLEPELRDIIRMFVPFFDMDLNVSLTEADNECHVKIGGKSFIYNNESKTGDNTAKNQTESEQKKEQSRRTKNCLYLALSDFFDAGLPWGSLTGIRPTKIGYNYLAGGGDKNKIAQMLRENYFVSLKKAMLTQEIIKNQGETARQTDKINLYIHIPFCPTKCSYCSFVSLPTAKNETLITEYLDLLNREIAETKQLIKAQNKQILSIYVGGGTPAVLNESQLASLLKTINAGGEEFTFEAGRPDEFSENKLKTLKDGGVTRICINPQTFLDKTLLQIGRSHSVSQIYQAYDISQKYGFDINMDLIAGLPDETLADFDYSLNKAIELKPHNITVHTLSIKNGSKISESRLGHAQKNKISESRLISADKAQTNEKIQINTGVVGQMTNLATEKLTQNNYQPYYLYRQKNMADSGENVGFCLPDKHSINNITTMEESASVYACGAGAISKKITGSRIERFAALRDVGLFVKNFDQKQQEKLNFLTNQFT